ncbi:type II toxin-antitoxin system RelE/ParE family toxin [Candidatus Regiella insecticola]|uniref:type II toxin-antitoxin system RelE/ParE family toxin n=1 Tax=Candidatus Regiella insecticola TaxID=138073 RepID=UPI00387E95B4
MRYTVVIIISFQHKGLRAFFKTGSTRRIQSAHARRLTQVLALLNRVESPESMNLPGYRLHQLKGKLAGFWSISISGNWRVIFRFVGMNVELVDYLDYH